MQSVVICGSRRFKSKIREFAKRLQDLGIVVYQPYLHSGQEEWLRLSDDYKKFVALGLTHDHFYKIRMADVVFVYNEGGYSGYSTTLEIGYAVAMAKPIYALHQDEELCRNVLFRGIISTPEELVRQLSSQYAKSTEGIMAMKKCDNKSVGMLVWRDNKLLLIERKKFPFGFAPPAGHVDSDNSFEEAAKKELLEEVSLQAKKMELVFEGRKENPCRRGGTWHYWKVYNVVAHGKLNRSESETKQAGWYSKNEVFSLAARTEKYLKGNILEEEWQKSPGLEPVWYEWWIKGLKMIKP